MSISDIIMLEEEEERRKKDEFDLVIYFLFSLNEEELNGYKVMKRLRVSV